MIVILKKTAQKSQLERLIKWLESMNIKVQSMEGEHTTILGLIGDTSMLEIDFLRSLEYVAEVKRIQEPYKNANRKFHPEDSIVDVCGFKIGGGHFQVIAGPCSVESEEQMLTVAGCVKENAGNMLRGGAFKPRTSPYAFQGLRAEGLEILLKTKKATGMPIVTEIMSTAHIPLFEDVDVIQVGARNMQNFELLKELGKLDKPILLKRGLANTIEELLMSAEYVMAGGNEKVILCERGIRTFEPSTRNTLDISAIPMIKKYSHLPVIVDPSHAAGIRWMVEPLAMAAIAAGADGLLIEVHNDPECALCDGAQSLTMGQFGEINAKIRKTAEFFGKKLD